MAARWWKALALTAASMSAHAQLRLPTLPLPAAPSQLLPPQPALQSLDPADPRNRDRLSSVRRLEIGRLLRANHRLLDSDAHGEPIVRGEILALSPSEAALDRARSAGYRVAREQSFGDGDWRVMVLTAPHGLSTQQALMTLRASDATAIYDYNHIYTRAESAPPHASTAQTAQAAPDEPAQRPRIRVGLVDTGVDRSHPIFKDSAVNLWGCADRPVPAAHGTAVASLMLAHVSADLYAADVYCGLPTGGSVDSIVAALGWMIQEHVAVINVSLVGPKNALLEHTVAALSARGHLLVAAVGNDGPAAPPLYPAAYPNVVGVTGVDANRRVLLEAVRGPQVVFAALGAGLKAANAEHTFSEVRGTSFAAPAVALLLAEMLSTPDPALAAAAVDGLAKTAIDLGPPGRDLTYGFGLVGAATP